MNASNHKKGRESNDVGNANRVEEEKQTETEMPIKRANSSRARGKMCRPLDFEVPLVGTQLSQGLWLELLESLSVLLLCVPTTMCSWYFKCPKASQFQATGGWRGNLTLLLETIPYPSMRHSVRRMGQCTILHIKNRIQYFYKSPLSN